MAYRKMLYGYIIRNGEMAIEPKEALVVKWIFTAYLAGASYQGIDDMLNEDKIVYSSENREWDKHKIKRLLENSRYMGEKDYPPIIETETFEEVQLLIASKTAGYKPRLSVEVKTEAEKNENQENQTGLIEQKAIYEPTLEVRQIDNAISKSLEKLDKPEEIMRLILKGITARYMCCG